MFKTLLLEIGTEEIPAGFIDEALEKLRQLSIGLFKVNRLKLEREDAILTHGTPRRLILMAPIWTKQEDMSSKIYGPPKSAAFDKEGKPTKAAIGFARAHGLKVEDLKVGRTEKGEYLCIEKFSPGHDAKEVLAELMPRLIFDIPFSKYMRWGAGNIRFVRPIRWIVALFGAEIVDFEIDGLKSGRASRGHRFISPARFEIKDAADLIGELEKRGVIADRTRRMMAIEAALNDKAAEKGGNVLKDEEMLRTVTNLVEYPLVICGGFGRDYLGLPREILLTTIIGQQKFFPIVDADGNLKPLFLAVANTPVEDIEIVKRGFERVLKARLDDAKFFYAEDLKRPFDKYIEKLSKIIFQEKLGTYLDKVYRLEALARCIAGGVSPGAAEVAARAARLCKADLVTSVVKEFPNLQGAMGREYARKWGEKEEVSTAIFEHYLPRYANDMPAKTLPGTIVSIADKIDTLVGYLGVGLMPSGSEDPYALRRQASGLVATIWANSIRLSLANLVDNSLSLYGAAIERPYDEVKNEVLNFVLGRAKAALGAQGFAYDIVDAVFSLPADDLLGLKKRVEALANFRLGHEFKSIAILFKRVENITKGFERKKIIESLLAEEVERNLYKAYIEIKTKVEQEVATEDFAEALSDIFSLKEKIDTFFDEVLVMAKAVAVRENRLSLLRSVAELLSPIADFSKIVVE